MKINAILRIKTFIYQKFCKVFAKLLVAALTPSPSPGLHAVHQFQRRKVGTGPALARAFHLQSSDLRLAGTTNTQGMEATGRWGLTSPTLCVGPPGQPSWCPCLPRMTHAPPVLHWWCPPVEPVSLPDQLAVAGLWHQTAPAPPARPPVHHRQ